MSDRMTLAHAIEDAGIPRDKAESMATAIARFVEGSTATKQDLERTEAALKTDINRVEYSLKAEIARLQHDLTMRGIAGMIAAGGILFAALRLWPPHG
jgi:hypothetical protein